MTGIQNEFVPVGAIQPEYVNEFYNNIIFQKIDILEQQLSVINKQIKMSRIELSFALLKWIKAHIWKMNGKKGK